jgi:hypothetical protein
MYVQVCVFLTVCVHMANSISVAVAGHRQNFYVVSKSFCLDVCCLCSGDRVRCRFMVPSSPSMSRYLSQLGALVCCLPWRDHIAQELGRNPSSVRLVLSCAGARNRYLSLADIVGEQVGPSACLIVWIRPVDARRLHRPPITGFDSCTTISEHPLVDNLEDALQVVSALSGGVFGATGSTELSEAEELELGMRLEHGLSAAERAEELEPVLIFGPGDLGFTGCAVMEA